MKKMSAKMKAEMEEMIDKADRQFYEQARSDKKFHKWLLAVGFGREEDFVIKNDTD